MKKLLIGLLGTLTLSTVFASGAFAGSAPWDDTVFVRGGFNDWGVGNSMAWDGSAYTATIALDAGDYEFKIANADWNGPDFGATGDPNVVFGDPIAVGAGAFNNLALSIVDPGNYLFTMFDIAPDLQSATLVVTQVVPIPAAGLLLLSAVGGLGFLRRRR